MLGGWSPLKSPPLEGGLCARGGLSPPPASLHPLTGVASLVERVPFEKEESLEELNSGGDKSLPTLCSFSTSFQEGKALRPLRVATQLSDNFLEWLIGFTEGDGSFIVTNRNDLQFVITQSTEDKSVLDWIQSTLGFGKVNAQGKRTSRFIVQDLKGIYCLLLLFNGNIVLPTRKTNFLRFLNVYNQKIKKLQINPGVGLIEPIQSQILPSLNTSWLAGFTDAEGCFTVSFLAQPRHAFRLRFIISQKGDVNLPILSHLILLFQTGSIETHTNQSNYSYICSGKKNCYKVYAYFDLFQLKTKKQKSYTLWKQIHKKISKKEHLDERLRQECIELAKQVNRIRRKSQ